MLFMLRGIGGDEARIGLPEARRPADPLAGVGEPWVAYYYHDWYHDDYHCPHYHHYHYHYIIIIISSIIISSSTTTTSVMITVSIICLFASSVPAARTPGWSKHGSSGIH